MKCSNLRAFVGSKDFETSREFYAAIGFAVKWQVDGLAEMALGDCAFLLQAYHQEDWCHNSMMYVDVEDAQEWHDKIQDVLAKRDYGEARVAKPKPEPHAALVTYLWDPSGVLWHLAQEK